MIINEPSREFKQNIIRVIYCILLKQFMVFHTFPVANLQDLLFTHQS